MQLYITSLLEREAGKSISPMFHYLSVFAPNIQFAPNIWNLCTFLHAKIARC